MIVVFFLKKNPKQNTIASYDLSTKQKRIVKSCLIIFIENGFDDEHDIKIYLIKMNCRSGSDKNCKILILKLFDSFFRNSTQNIIVKYPMIVIFLF